jgi:sec-independent protein translocase protein TatA
MYSYFALLDLGAPQLLIILVVVLVLFGSKRLPELSRSISESAHELRKGAGKVNELKQEVSKQALELKRDFNGELPRATDKSG